MKYGTQGEFSLPYFFFNIFKSLLEKIRSGLQPRAAARQNRKKRIMEIKRIKWKLVEHALRKGK